jgi:hypothetical protein
VTIFARDPTHAFPEATVVALNEVYERELQKRGYGDTRTLLEAILYETAFHYHATRWIEDTGFLGADTLDDVAAHCDTLLALLSGDPNRHRLLAVMLGIKDGCATNDIFGTSHRLSSFLTSLKEVSAAARAAHHPARAQKDGRPVKTRDLRAAYAFLAPWALRLFGPERFINTWNKTGDGKTVPGGLGTSLIFDILSVVDPDRNGLDKSLKRLMGETVRELPGPRPGRKLS